MKKYTLYACCMLVLLTTLLIGNKLYAFRPSPFSLTVSSEHNDRFPEPAVVFTVSWDVPQGKAVTVREGLPDGTYTLIENVYPPLKRNWGSATGTWTYLAYVQENGETTYLSNTAKVTVPSPPEQSLLLDDFEDNNFWQPGYSVGWWDSSTAAYRRSSVNSPVYSGTSCMRINYDKSGDPWSLFSAYISADNYRRKNLADYDLITLWANGDADILVKFRDGSGNEQDVDTQHIYSGDGWRKLAFDYSQLNLVDLNNIENIMFFIMPGDGSSKGTFYVDEMRLERLRPVLLEDFQDTNFWTPDETVGWWDSNGTRIYQRSRAYQQLSAADIPRPVMEIKYNKNGDPWSLFGAYISSKNPLRDFSRHSKLTVWIRSQTGASILAKLRDRKQREEDIATQSLNSGWSKLELDYSGLRSVDLSDIENILFFIDPGNASSSGVVDFADICLE